MKKFTLIELLVVLAVVGILLTILLPSLKKARIAAQAAICNSNNRQISVALMSYSTKNDGYWPYGPKVEPSSLAGAHPPWGGLAPQEMLFSYAGESIETFVCPLDKTPEDYKWWYFSKRVNFIGSNQKSSYMFNVRALWKYAKQYDRPLRYTDLNNPYEWPQMSDGSVVVSGDIWDRCDPAFTGGWGVIDWWHNNYKVSLLMEMDT